MKYLECSFKTTPCTEIINDILTSYLGDVGFDSFMNDEEGIKAYIQDELFDEDSIKKVIDRFPIEGTQINYTYNEVEDKDWNEEWERNFFKPIIIDNRCVIHSTEHKNIPQTEYDIIINPKMSFGTGHHETTGLMMEEILDTDFSEKNVLDMGCGTAILSILASKKGAKKVTGIDIDNWCVGNSNENIALNHINNITVELGDAQSLKGRHFDIIIANINRNILINDMKYYAACMQKGSILFMSGFYKEDIPLIREEAEKQHLNFCHYHENNRWVAVKFVMEE